MFVRSPMLRIDASCSNGTDWYIDEIDGMCSGSRACGVNGATASATARTCSVVVPQQPPTRRAP